MCQTRERVLRDEQGGHTSLPRFYFSLWKADLAPWRLLCPLPETSAEQPAELAGRNDVLKGKNQSTIQSWWRICCGDLTYRSKCRSAVSQTGGAEPG